jgi:hypothetical protein
VRALAVSLFVTLFAAAPAGAATVRVTSECDRSVCEYNVAYTAAPGERNVLSADETRGTIVVHDAGAAVAAGVGCTAVAGGVTCSPPVDIFATLVADLGDGDDVSTANGVIDGGPGNDRLSGVGAFTGGPGEDVLSGSGSFTDGDGAKPAHDVYTGDGRSSLSYAGRRAGVRIDLRAGRAGEDRATGMINATGGDGADVLIGTDGPNDLTGGDGGDRIVGLAGDDDIITGQDTGGSSPRPGAPDTVEAGAGRDTVNDTSDAGHSGNVIRCGGGVDRVVQLRAYDLVDGDCEIIDAGGDLEMPAHLHATLAAPGSSFLGITLCACSGGRYVARARGRTVGSAHGKVHRLNLRLNALGRRMLVHSRRLTVRVQFRVRYGGELEILGFRTVLRLR